MINKLARLSFYLFSIITVSNLLSSCSSPLKYEPRDNSVQKPKQTKVSGVCGRSYKVKSGDTLSGIAYKCDLDMMELATINNLLPPYIIYIKQTLKLPNKTKIYTSKIAKSNKDQQVKPKVIAENTSSNVEKKATNTSSKKAANPKVQKQQINKAKPKPVTKTVTAKAIERKPTKPRSSKPSKWVWPMHKGIGYKYRRDKAGLSVLEVYGVPGQSISAVAPGKVVYSGNGIANYGWMLVIKHDHDYMSIYAHNSALLVSEGEYVEAGQEIANLGATGNTNRPKLYLEARYQGRKIDIKKKLKY
jgi:murein DD-endopeptidase MepM/ murein hydrolase activator NlpD